MFYSIKEGITGLVRTKFSSAISISVICISLLLIGFFLLVLVNGKRLLDSIQDRIELEVFIDNSYEPDKTGQLKKQIQQFDGILDVKYISKEEAAEIFKKQFNEDVFEILNENPLPASFQITISKPYRTSDKMNHLIAELQKLEGVDDIEFRKDIMVLLERYSKLIVIVISVLGGLLLLGSILLVTNTIKLVILSRRRIIEAMILVGATRSFIRWPFIFEGLIQGIVGAIIATSFYHIMMLIINIEIPGLIIVDQRIYLILLALGLFLGFVGSLVAIQRFLKL